MATLAHPIQPEYCSDQYRRSFIKQSVIGWNHVLQRRLASNWISAQERCITSPTTKVTSFLSKLVSIIISHAHSASKLRNDAPHASNPTFQEYQRHHILISRLAEIYATRTNMLALDPSLPTNFRSTPKQ